MPTYSSITHIGQAVSVHLWDLHYQQNKPSCTAQVVQQWPPGEDGYQHARLMRGWKLPSVTAYDLPFLPLNVLLCLSISSKAIAALKGHKFMGLKWERWKALQHPWISKTVLNGESHWFYTLLDFSLSDPAVPWLQECKLCCEPCGLSIPHMGVKEQLEELELFTCGQTV